MSRIWFTSDLHFGHTKVATVYRPFETVEEHDETLIAKWRRWVGEDDSVYVLGDLALGSVDYALAIMADLPGVKHFISGNHDSCHPMHRRWRKALPQFLEVFATVQPFGSIRHGQQQILLSHFPYQDDHVDPPRYMQWRLPNHGQWLLHGHTHDAQQRLHGREIHVGVDAWGFAPVELGTITKLMEAANGLPSE